MKTIAEQLKHDFDKGSLRLYDSNGNEIYYEDSDGYWIKREFDSNGNLIYYETSKGYWSKKEYDSNGNRIYYENSNGAIEDNRPNEITQDKVREVLNEVAELYPYKEQGNRDSYSQYNEGWQDAIASIESRLNSKKH